MSPLAELMQPLLLVLLLGVATLAVYLDVGPVVPLLLCVGAILLIGAMNAIFRQET